MPSTSRWYLSGSYQKPKSEWFPESMSDYTSTSWWPIAFYNCGHHLYLETGEPRFIRVAEQARMTFLPFRRYSKGSNVNGVHFYHQGHLFGIRGGDVTVELELSGLLLRPRIRPRSILWVNETSRMVKLFASKYPVSLAHVPKP